MNCVLKFGDKPKCPGDQTDPAAGGAAGGAAAGGAAAGGAAAGGAAAGGAAAGGVRRRRRDARQDDASVSVTFTVTPGDGEYSVSDGVVTGTAKAADSGGKIIRSITRY